MKTEDRQSKLARGFGTFWDGPVLSAMERACLQSFVAQNREVTLFSYDSIPNLPEGVRGINASEILPESLKMAFLYNGRPHLGHFSDYFRYTMIKSAGLIWVDADIVLLREFGHVNLQGNLFAREASGGINAAVFYTPDARILQTLITETEKLMHRNLSWGETGPVLLTRVINEAGLAKEATDHSIFYPVQHDDIGKVLLPQFREWCDEACGSATTLYLNNNIIERMGYWKDMAPPVGSFLYNEFKKTGALSFFSSIIPEAVMRNQVNNFKWSQTGEQIGFKSTLKQFAPSLLRTMRHHGTRVKRR